MTPEEARERRLKRQRAYYLKNREKAKAQARAWNAANPERAKETRRRYRETHPELFAEAQRKWREANPGLAAKRAAIWYHANKERARERQRKYVEKNRVANRPKLVVKEQRRKARLRAAFVEDVEPLELLNRGRGLCGICLEYVDPLNFDIDHIQPLAKGGEHSYANCQPAHPSCNFRKGAKWPWPPEESERAA